MTEPEDSFRDLGVSRETMARLQLYAELLVKWQVAVNLVAPSTIPELWQRHMLDSAQLWPLLPKRAKVLLDLGSGAGFPGLVLAIMGVPEVHLVESDLKKSSFLREVARETGANVTVHAERISRLEPINADVVSARALAPLPRLLTMAAPWLEKGAIGLFPKGELVAQELTQARRQWTMRLTTFPSRTSPNGTILRVESLRHGRDRDHD